MNSLIKGLVLVTFSVSSVAMAKLTDAQKKERGEKIVKEFTSNIKDVTPRIGNFAFVSCQDNFALSSIDIGVSAKLKNTVELPFLTAEGQEQKILIGSKDVEMNFNVFTEKKLAPVLKFDEINLRDMNFNCQKQEEVEYQSELTFRSGDKEYADISYTHPTIGSVRLQIDKFRGKAIKLGDDMYAAVEGVAKLETYNKKSNKIIYQDIEMLLRFHYNNAGETPILNMDGAQIAGQIKDKLILPEVAVEEEDKHNVAHENFRIRVLRSVSLRDGASKAANYVADAAEVTEDGILEVRARSGMYLNVVVDGRSLWLYGGKKFVEYL